MTDAATITKHWTYAVDDLAVEFCCDGYIGFARLTASEREVVATRLTAAGYGPTEIARRTHGTVSAVVAALDRDRDRTPHREASR